MWKGLVCLKEIVVFATFVFQILTGVEKQYMKIILQIPQSNFSLCIVLSDDPYSEIRESSFQISQADLPQVFMYHERGLQNDNYRDCKFYKRRVTLGMNIYNKDIGINVKKYMLSVHKNLR